MRFFFVCNYHKWRAFDFSQFSQLFHVHSIYRCTVFVKLSKIRDVARYSIDIDATTPRKYMYLHVSIRMYVLKNKKGQRSFYSVFLHQNTDRHWIENRCPLLRGLLGYLKHLSHFHDTRCMITNLVTCKYLTKWLDFEEKRSCYCVPCSHPLSREFQTRAAYLFPILIQFNIPIKLKGTRV